MSRKWLQYSLLAEDMLKKTRPFSEKRRVETEDE